MAEAFGQGHVPVNLSARQAKEAGLLTSGTYGQRSIGSSASENLMLFLVNRLKAKTDVLGSTLFKLTWKQVAMPSGRSVCVLRASALRISGNDCFLWPTPRAEEAEHSGRTKIKDGQTVHLAAIANLASWPTPQSSDMTGGGQAKRIKGRSNLNDYAMLSSWQTPNTVDAKLGNRNGEGQVQLCHQALLANWQTPTVQDAYGRDRHNQTNGTVILSLLGEARQTDFGQTPSGSTVEMESIGQLNPAHSLWLMGLPPEWLNCVELAMQSLPRSQKRS